MDIKAEVRVANYYGDFQTLLARYSEEFQPIPAEELNEHHFSLTLGFGKEIYSFIATQSEGFRERYGYNVLLAVIGPRKERAKELMGAWEARLMVESRQAPDIFYERVPALKKIYLAMKRDFGESGEFDE